MTFKKAPPRHMNGMARMMAQAKPLPPFVRGVVEKQAAMSLPTIDPSVVARIRDDVNLRDTILTALKRLGAAEKKVQYIENVMAKFRQQCDQLPAGHGARTLIEQVLDTFAGAIEEAQRVADEAHEAALKPQPPAEPEQP